MFSISTRAEQLCKKCNQRRYACIEGMLQVQTPTGSKYLVCFLIKTKRKCSNRIAVTTKYYPDLHNSKNL